MKTRMLLVAALSLAPIWMAAAPAPTLAQSFAIPSPEEGEWVPPSHLTPSTRPMHVGKKRVKPRALKRARHHRRKTHMALSSEPTAQGSPLAPRAAPGSLFASPASGSLLPTPRPAFSLSPLRRPSPQAS